MNCLTLPSKQFEIFSKTGISTEHSNLRRWYQLGDWPQEFYIESEKTGKSVLFRRSVSEFNRDNELECVKYVSPTDSWIPTVTIFND